MIPSGGMISGGWVETSWVKATQDHGINSSIVTIPIYKLACWLRYGSEPKTLTQQFGLWIYDH